MQIAVGIKFKGNSKVYHFKKGDLELNLHDEVIVETAFGLEIGEVVQENIEAQDNMELKKVVRLATQKDREIFEKTQNSLKEILNRAREIIKMRKVNMPLSEVKSSFDGKSLLFIYTTDERVDFRELLKDFAKEFKAKIEFKQIGTRDEAKMFGGIGPCGRECCCAEHLKQFPQANIKMAKNQGIALNPYSINGLCGKLMCCLTYENDFYTEVLKEMPNIGKKVKTPDGEGVAQFNDVFKKITTVRFQEEDGGTKFKEYPVGDLKFDK